MTEPSVTVVVVSRERFSMSRRALETLYRNTDTAFRLVYVDGGSPASIKRYLETESRSRGFQLLRTDHYLSPNQARNMGLQLVTTKYVAFIDNDVLVTPGWLGTLLACAEETSASVVGPLYLMGELSRPVVHMAGGSIEIEVRERTRVLRERHHFPHTPLASIGALTRRTTDVVEFHCMLVLKSVLERFGGLDEGLLSANEHIDLCMMVRQAGGTVYLEPESVVTYIGPRPLAASDLPFYLLRWSDAWNAASIRRFNEKWSVEVEKDFGSWLTNHRRTFLQPLHDRLHGLVGWRAGSWLERVLVHPIEERLNRIVVRAVSKTAGPSV
jgi:GT2 family glycosyltransferase